jgi:hypothetical protein
MLADGGFVGEDAGSGQGCPQLSCSSYGSSDTVESVVAILSEQPWTTIAKSTSACLAASDEIPVGQTVNLRATDVTVPAACQKMGTCSGLVFELGAGTEGVTCLDQFCTALMLASARFRVRMVLRDHYPLSPRYAPVVQVLAPCGTPCTALEVTCPTSQTCWSDAMEHCRFCLDGSAEVCACAAHGEGQSCTVFISNDTSCHGHCATGTCKIDPNQTGCPSI